MKEMTRCKNCRSTKWEKVGIVSLSTSGKVPNMGHMYQCGHCKRIIIIGGELPMTDNPLDVI